MKTRMMLVKCLIVPAFTYGKCFFSTNLSSVSITSLERAFSACVRFFYGLHDSTRNRLDCILGAPILTYLRQRCCVTLRSIISTETPAYLFDKIRRGSSLRRNAHILPKHSSLQYNRSFFVRTVSDYNLLPRTIGELNSLESFKSSCLTYLKTLRN